MKGGTMRPFAQLVSAPLLFLICGCATLFTPTTQSVPIASAPEGAEVFVDGEFVGTTPLTVELRTRQNHEVTVRLGDEVRTWTLARQLGTMGTVGFVGDGVILAGGLAVGFTGAALSAGFTENPGTLLFLVVAGVGAAPLVIDLSVDDFYVLAPSEITAQFE